MSFIKVNLIERSIPKIRLEGSLDMACKESLESILEKAHAKAVELAPKRYDTVWKHYPLPEQLAAPGLLKNSIVYAVDDEPAKGANSTDGAKVKNSYISFVANNLSTPPSRKGVHRGYLATSVRHADYVNWTGKYKKDITVETEVLTHSGSHRTQVSRQTVEMPYSDSVAKFPYGSYIEFNKQPFIRPALYSVRDGEDTKVFAEVFRRDILEAVKAGLKNENLRVLN